MQGEKINLLKIATKQLLDQLEQHDTFSIVLFNEKALCLSKNLTASQTNIAQAKAKIEEIKASGGTKFVPAFKIVKDLKLISAASESSIIFLTDGEDSNNPKCTDLVKLASHQGKKVRIIPIGIGLDKITNKTAHQFLCRLAAEHSLEAIFIKEITSESFINAFQQAFELTIEHSSAAADVEMIIEAKHPVHATRVTFKRKLECINYNGDPYSYSFFLESPTDLTSCQVKFSCDGISLQGEHVFSERELNEIGTNNNLSIPLKKLKWKDNTWASWAKCLGLMSLGLLFIGGGIIFALLTPLNFLLTLMVISILGSLGSAALVYAATQLCKLFFSQPLPAAGSPIPKKEAIPLSQKAPSASHSASAKPMAKPKLNRKPKPNSKGGNPPPITPLLKKNF